MEFTFSLDWKLNLPVTLIVKGAKGGGAGLDGRMDRHGTNLESNIISVLKMV